MLTAASEIISGNRRDGFLLQFSISTDTVAWKYQKNSSKNIRENSNEKICVGVLCLISATKPKHFMIDSFQVIFLSISEQLFQGTQLDGCFFKVFCSTETIAGKCQKSCSQKFDKFLKKQSVAVHIFLILGKKTTPPLMVS